MIYGPYSCLIQSVWSFLPTPNFLCARFQKNGRVQNLPPLNSPVLGTLPFFVGGNSWTLSFWGVVSPRLSHFRGLLVFFWIHSNLGMARRIKDPVDVLLGPILMENLVSFFKCPLTFRAVRKVIKDKIFQKSLTRSRRSQTCVKYSGNIICIKRNTDVKTSDLNILHKKPPNKVEFPDAIFKFLKILFDFLQPNAWL